MTVGTGIAGEANSVSCGRIFFPSGYKCCTDVCIAKENALFAFESGVGLDRSGMLYNVTCDSWGLSNEWVTGNCLRTRQNNERVYILHKSQLVDSPPCEVFLGLQMGHSESVTLYSSHKTYGFMDQFWNLPAGISTLYTDRFPIAVPT